MVKKKRNLYIKWIFIIMVGVLLLSGCEERWPTDPEETERPEISETDPPVGVAGVPTGAPISITFHEEMDESTMNDTLFTLVDSAGNAVDGSLSWSDASTLLFTPSGDLEQMAAYTAVILGAFTEDDEWKGPSVRDKNGNSLEYDIVIDFVTEGNYGSLPIYLSCGPNIGEGQLGRISIPDYEIQTINGFDLPMGMTITPDGQYLYVANREGNSVSVVEMSSFTIVDEIDLTISEEPWVVMTKPDGSEVWVLSRALPCAISIIDVATNTISDTINLSSPVDYCPAGGFPYRMVFSSDGGRAFVTTRLSQSVLKINADLHTVQRETVIPSAAHISEVAISPDDEKVYVSNTWGSEPSLYVLDSRADMPVIDSIDLPEEWGDAKKFTTFGDYLYVAMRWEAMIYKIDMNIDEVIDWTGWCYDWFGDWVDNEYIEVDISGEVIYMINPDRGKIALFDSDLNYIGDINPQGAWWGIVSRPGRGIQ